jgi:hypothetical protein
MRAMRSRNAEAELRRFLGVRGLPLPVQTPKVAEDSMLAFFVEVPALDCRGVGRDMLLFQW